MAPHLPRVGLRRNLRLLRRLVFNVDVPIPRQRARMNAALRARGPSTRRAVVDRRRRRMWRVTPQHPGAADVTGADERLARRLVEEVFTQGDLAVVDELIAHDDVDHSSTPLERASLAVVKDRVTVLRRAFPDLHLIVEDQIVEADRVVTRSTVRGTHAGESSASHPPAVGSCSSSSTSPRSDDGRIAEYWAVVDTHSLLQQLGALCADSAA